MQPGIAGRLTCVATIVSRPCTIGVLRIVVRVAARFIVGVMDDHDLCDSRRPWNLSGDACRQRDGLKFARRVRTF